MTEEWQQERGRAGAPGLVIKISIHSRGAGRFRAALAKHRAKPWRSLNPAQKRFFAPKIYQTRVKTEPLITNIVTIVLDFSEAEANARISAITEYAKKNPEDFVEKTIEDFIKELLWECEVHRNRFVTELPSFSVEIMERRTLTFFLKMCPDIPNEP